MASTSITKELLSLVSPYSYCECIPCLDTDDFIAIRKFKDHEVGGLFNIDHSDCLNNGEINNDHLFNLFGQYSDESADSVCSDAVECIESGKRVYTEIGKEFFERPHWSFNDWALSVCSQYYHGDEMLLYILCRIFHRHAVVICHSRYWCMFDNPLDMPIKSILDACDLHLVYLRPGIFGELRLKKWHGSLTRFSPPEFPAWSGNALINKTDLSSTDNNSEGPTMLKKCSANQTLPSGPNTDSIANTDVIKSGNIVTDPLDVDSPHVTPNQENILNSGPSTARMLARNKPTVHPKIRHAIVKPAWKAETIKVPMPNPSEAESTKQKDTDTSENDDIPLARLRSKSAESAEASTSHSPPKTNKKHVFVSKTVGLIKQKKRQTFKCSKCDKRSSSLAELNTHYRASHAKVKCKYYN